MIEHNIKNFFAGDSINFIVSSDDYKSTENFTLVVTLQHAVNARIELLANTVADGSFSIVKQNNETSSFQAGTYRMYFSFIKSSQGFTKQFDMGTLKIGENILDTLNVETRTETQQRLDAVRELIKGRLVDGVNAMSHNGKSLTLMSMTELKDYEKELEGKVSVELGLSDKVKFGKTNRNRLRLRYKSR